MLAATLALALQRAPQQGPGVRPGQPAPIFKLDLLEKDKSFDLKDHIGKRPVVVVFGSYT